MVFFVTRLCFYRSRLYFLLMSTKNIDRASIDGSIGGGCACALLVALAPSFASLLQYLPCLEILTVVPGILPVLLELSGAGPSVFTRCNCCRSWRRAPSSCRTS